MIVPASVVEKAIKLFAAIKPSHVKVDERGFWATNFDTSIHVPAGVVNGSRAIPFSALKRLPKPKSKEFGFELSKDGIEITWDGAGILKIGKARKEFPPLPDVAGESRENEALGETTQNGIPFLLKESFRFALFAFQSTPTSFFACNGRFGYIDENGPFPDGLFKLPKLALLKTIKSFRETDRFVAFEGDGFTITTRKHEGKILKYDDIRPETPNECKFKTADFDAAIRFFIKNKDADTIAVYPDTDGMHIRQKTDDDCEAVLMLGPIGPKIKPIGLNPELVAKVLPFKPNRLLYADPNTAVLFPVGESRTVIIMPKIIS